MTQQREKQEYLTAAARADAGPAEDFLCATRRRLGVFVALLPLSLSLSLQTAERARAVRAMFPHA